MTNRVGHPASPRRPAAVRGIRHWRGMPNPRHVALRDFTTGAMHWANLHALTARILHAGLGGRPSPVRA